jgi:hypothetical protein
MNGKAEEKLVDYKLMEANEIDQLNKMAKEMLAGGWELYGSPSVYAILLNPGSGTPQVEYTYIQAIVKKNQPEFQYAK